MKENKFDLFKKFVFHDNNFDINQQCENTGNTLLHEAVYLNKSQFIEFLLEWGADKTIKNLDGMEAFHPNLKFKKNKKKLNKKIMNDETRRQF